MTALVVTHIDRKAIPLERRQAFSATADFLTGALYSAAERYGKGVAILNTCERFEVYCTTGQAGLAPAAYSEGRWLGHTATVSGVDALRHLFRVAAGLESRIPGEPHVLGQVRLALREARRRHTAHPEIADALVHAVRCGRRVRSQTAFGSSASSYTSRAVARLSHELNGLRGRSVAIVGSGAIAVELASALRLAGASRLTIVGRHEERVAAVAHAVGATPCTLHTLHTAHTHFAALISAVSAAQPVIDVHTLTMCHTRLLIDLGAAPNIAPDVGELPGVRVLRLEDLGGCDLATIARLEASTVVEREVARYEGTRRAGDRAHASISGMAS